jgi:hypothetical protein
MPHGQIPVPRRSQMRSVGAHGVVAYSIVLVYATTKTSILSHCSVCVSGTFCGRLSTVLRSPTMLSIPRVEHVYSIQSNHTLNTLNSAVLYFFHNPFQNSRQPHVPKCHAHNHNLQLCGVRSDPYSTQKNCTPTLHRGNIGALDIILEFSNLLLELFKRYKFILC